jgi:hypothetical protein
VKPSPIRPASYEHLAETPANLVAADGMATHVVRAANFVITVSDGPAGARLERHAQPDEYFVLLPDAGAVVSAGGERIESAGNSVLIVPPGDSSVELLSAGRVVRVFSHHAADLLPLASNAAAYAQGAEDVAPLETWPEPVGGYRLRRYALDDYVREDTTMRLFRTRHLMVNVFLPRKVPRDIHKLSPHQHADFEQGSLALAGTYVHHCRYPWTPDLSTWREDEHVQMAPPSVMIVPPKVTHTSMNIDAPGWLVDIFAPPRDDFSLKPGLVCNADEYPLPPRLAG